MSKSDLLMKEHAKPVLAKVQLGVPCTKGVPSNVNSEEPANGKNNLTWREIVELSKPLTERTKEKCDIKNFNRSHVKTWLWDLNDKIGKDTMKSTTKIMLEEGANKKKRFCLVERKLINFTSFDMKDGRYGSISDKRKMHQPMASTYARTFTNPYLLESNKFDHAVTTVAETPDYLFNRLPKNDFDPKAGQGHKFLDDHMHNITQVRKKINFFRQIRNQSFVM